MVQIDEAEREANEAKREVDIWMGDTGFSHHIKSSRQGMIEVENCPPGTRIRQVQGVVDVKEWGTVLLDVDGVQGKRLMRLREVLIVPNIKVNLFSLQRVIDIGYIPVFGEKAGKCLIKEPIDGEVLVQVATMTVKTGRLTLDCRVVDAYK